MKLSIDDLRKFTDLMDDFRHIERIILTKNSDRAENDSEHSYSLAMMAWYIVDAENLNLNVSKVVRYALAHDLIEVYAGDSFFYRTEAEKAEKKRREAEAVKKIQAEFPKFEALHQYIAEYEERSSAEAQFVYALDKLIPMLIIFQAGGSLWKKKNITLDMAIGNKSAMIESDSTLREYWKDFKQLLLKHKHYFADEKVQDKE